MQSCGGARRGVCGLHCTGAVQGCSHLAVVGHALRCSEEVVDDTDATQRLRCASRWDDLDRYVGVSTATDGHTNAYRTEYGRQTAR